MISRFLSCSFCDKGPVIADYLKSSIVNRKFGLQWACAELFATSTRKDVLSDDRGLSERSTDGSRRRCSILLQLNPKNGQSQVPPPMHNACNPLCLVDFRCCTSMARHLPWL
jgi:hypothetical protein